MINQFISYGSKNRHYLFYLIPSHKFIKYLLCSHIIISILLNSHKYIKVCLPKIYYLIIFKLLSKEHIGKSLFTKALDLFDKWIIKVKINKGQRKFV